MIQRLRFHVPVLRPESTLRSFWDIFTGISILYSLIYLPIFAFFEQPEVCNPKLSFSMR